AVLNLRHLVARNDSANLCRLPVVILGNEAIGVVQLQLRIGQGVRHAELGKRWTDRSNNYSRGLSHNDKSTDHDVVSCLHETSRADVGEEGSAVWAQIVNFREAVARGVINTAHNCGVVPRRQCSDKSGLERIAW